MHMGSRRGWRLLVVAGCSAVVCLTSGCGWIADKDRIVVAELDGQPITRGDLFRIIREMPDDERPHIRNKGDLLRVLNNYIDEEIKEPLAAELDRQLEESRREMLRAQAREEVFRRYEDYNYRQIYAMEVPPDDQETPAMQTYNITSRGLRNMKDLIDNNTEEVYRKLLGTLALGLRGRTAFESGGLQISREALEREYELHKNEYLTFEWMRFRALRFPATPQGIAASAEVRRRMENDTSFDALFEEFAARGPQFVMESEIENNPALEKFRGFWENASGAEAGEIVGPVYLPTYTQQRIVGDEVASVEMPDAYLVLEVLERRPARPMTIEEAAPGLIVPLYTAAMMQRLREDHDVSVYEDKLPEVSGFSE
ncbi:MAG TPA: peptidylprolyl isomerase [Candidatus Hydrogenedentes bacterium]|nr:peptidylprolyl isomerase [Candidatus Hydrogenedentota bacterium]